MAKRFISPLTWFVILFSAAVSAAFLTQMADYYPYLSTSKAGWAGAATIGFAFLILVFSQIVTKLVAYLIIRYEYLHAHLSHDTSSGPQKFHATPTPRIGGIAIIVGLLVSSAVLNVLPLQFASKEFGLLLLASMPAFLGGLTEDITKKVSVTQRLGLTMLSAGFGIWLLGAIVTRLDIPGLNNLWMPLAAAFTVFAIAGLTNAINIIDGYNGLASGFGIIATASLAFISVQVGDTFLLVSSMAMLGALLGFIVWNWPAGKLFLGDGGAYLLGFWLSEISVLLVVRHPEISVWLPLAFMIYPVFETLFSIYRRKIKRNLNPGHPDAAHLHQLVYKRMVRIHIGSPAPSAKTQRNSRVAPYIWILTGTFSLIAILSAQYPIALQLISLCFCISYVLFYRRLLSWRIPEILKVRNAKPKPRRTQSS